MRSFNSKKFTERTRFIKEIKKRQEKFLPGDEHLEMRQKSYREGVLFAFDDIANWAYEEGKQKLVELMLKGIRGEMGCFTGDCPHNSADQCDEAIRKWVNDANN